MAERYRWLDVLRGVAILGILPVNVLFFALPISASDRPLLGSGAGARDVAASIAIGALFEYKFITLFSFLFGVGMAILRARAEADGRPYRSIMLRRLLALWAVGVGHAVLVWYGDILSYYAPLGLLLFWASSWEPRALERLGAALVILPAVAMAVFLIGLLVAADNPIVVALAQPHEWPQGDAEAARVAATGSWSDFADAMESFGPALETAIYREGSFARITALRFATWVMSGLGFGIYFSWRIAGLFLLGMAWAKSGWLLRPAENRARFRTFVALGLGAGVPLQVLASVLFREGAAPWAHVAAELCQYAGSLGLSAAYAGAIGLWVARGGCETALRPLEAIGKTAFSCYILQSIVCTMVFYSYGLALFGTLDRLELLGVAGFVWALQLVAAPLWLRRFRMGPLEWAWRAATYGALPSMRRS